MRKNQLLLGLLMASSVSAFATPGKRLAKGTYAADGINVTVEGETVKVEVGCGHGEFARPEMDDEDSFAVNGWMETDAMILNKKPQPTQFLGHLNDGGRTLELYVGRSEYDLKKGPLQPLMKCK